jgi:hypothetical protein
MRGLVHSVNTIYKGRRWGSFLEVDKQNITILPEVHSKRLIINDADRTAMVAEKGADAIKLDHGDLYH